MEFVRCPFCHEHVDADHFERHRKKHTARREDGQQKDYATLPPDEREDGDISDEPKWYVHEECDVTTGMPEDIVRSYLKNPWLYSSDQTFCHGCKTHVPFRECVWTETDENLQTYFDRLRAAKPHLKPKGCGASVAVLLAVAAGIGWRVFGA